MWQHDYSCEKNVNSSCFSYFRRGHVPVTRRSFPPLPAILPLQAPNDTVEPSLTVSPTLIHSCRSSHILWDWRPWGCSTQTNKLFHCGGVCAHICLVLTKSDKARGFRTSVVTENLPPHTRHCRSRHQFNILCNIACGKVGSTNVYTFTNCSCYVKSSVQNVNISGTAKSCLVFGFITVHFFKYLLILKWCKLMQKIIQSPTELSVTVFVDMTIEVVIFSVKSVCSSEHFHR